MGTNAINKVDNFLEHYGILGMKWGHRQSIGITRKRQEEFSKRDLKKLDEGGHISRGITKSRQAAYDARDRKKIEETLAKVKSKPKEEKLDTSSADHKRKVELKKKKVKELSNADLKDLTNRLQLEKQYQELSPTKIKKGMNMVKKITAGGTTLASLYALTKTPLGQDIIKAVRQKSK